MHYQHRNLLNCAYTIRGSSSSDASSSSFISRNKRTRTSSSAGSYLRRCQTKKIVVDEDYDESANLNAATARQSCSSRSCLVIKLAFTQHEILHARHSIKSSIRRDVIMVIVLTARWLTSFPPTVSPFITFIFAVLFCFFRFAFPIAGCLCLVNLSISVT